MGEQNIFFSVIVPIFNPGENLKKCIRSILSQTFRGFECILVDDGSDDGSGDLIDKYAFEDDRIKIIHKQNGGLSSARNVGLEIASGQWIVHVDSDDYIHPMTLEKLKGYIGSYKDVEVVMYEHIDVYPNKKRVIHHVYEEGYYGLIDRNKAIRQALTGCPFLVTKVMRADVAKRIKLREDIRRGADTVYVLETEDIIKKALVVSDPMYYYVQSSGSLARSKITPMQLTVLDSNTWIYEFITNRYPEYSAYVTDAYVNTRVNLFYKMFISDYEDEEIKTRIVKECHEKYVLLRKDGALSMKQRIKYGVFNKNPRLYCRLFKLVVNMIPGQRYEMYKTK